MKILHYQVGGRSTTQVQKSSRRAKCKYKLIANLIKLCFIHCRTQKTHQMFELRKCAILRK